MIQSDKMSLSSFVGIGKTLNPKGFGFISMPDETHDLFFRSDELRGVTFDELREGDRVSFFIKSGEKGLSAVEVARK
jgi:CspA family cold shock protein